MGKRLTTGPPSSSSSPSHLLAFTGCFGTTTAGVVGFFVVSSSEASQSDIAKPAQRMRKQKGESQREWKRLDQKFWSGSTVRSPRDQRGLPNLSPSSRNQLRDAMASATRDTLLKLALPLVKNHGFTRSALSLAVMHSPSGNHTTPLNDTAVDALFGEGDEARRTLIHAWLDDARVSLRTPYSQDGATSSTIQTPSLESVLKTRLSKNEDVLTHFPEVSMTPNSNVFASLMRRSDSVQAFALLATPSTFSSLAFPLTLDPRPAISHSMHIAAEACQLSGDTSVGVR